jgi:hypothetical protein
MDGCEGGWLYGRLGYFSQAAPSEAEQISRFYDDDDDDGGADPLDQGLDDIRADEVLPEMQAYKTAPAVYSSNSRIGGLSASDAVLQAAGASRHKPKKSKAHKEHKEHKSGKDRKEHKSSKHKGGHKSSKRDKPAEAAAGGGGGGDLLGGGDLMADFGGGGGAGAGGGGIDDLLDGGESQTSPQQASDDFFVGGGEPRRGPYCHSSSARARFYGESL